MDVSFPYNIIDALKTGKRIYIIDYEDLDKVDIVVNIKKVKEGLGKHHQELA